MSMRKEWPIVVAALFTVLPCAPAGAADPDPASPPPPPAATVARNWTGFYLGAHTGAAVTTSTFSDPYGSPLFGGDVTSPGALGGVQLGYDWLAAPQLLVGVAADASVLASSGANTCLQSSVTVIGSNCTVSPRELATLTGRLGFLTEPHGRTLFYGKAGVAWTRADVSLAPNNAFGNWEGAPLTGAPNLQGNPATQSASSWGWTVGAGIEQALSPGWSLSLEYGYLGFSGFGISTPQTINVAIDGNVTGVPPGAANLTQNMHVAKLGLSYRWGVAARDASADAATAASAAASSWTPGWEVEAGARYWYSSGKFQSANGPSNVLLSRLTYSDMLGHSGEMFGRVDSPFNVFVKGVVGTGFIAGGKQNDEDWALPDGLPVAYEVTESTVRGSFNYLTVDLGFNALRGRDHKVGIFAGYHRFQTVMDAMGCFQLVQNLSGVCSAPFTPDTNGVSEQDTWQALRVGVSGEMQFWDRFKVGGDFAYLPYVRFDGLDIHRAREPPVLFYVEGLGQGVQAEIILSYLLTERLSVGVGGRYWAMWTTSANQVGMPDSTFSGSNERYGVFVQLAYKFGQ